MNQQENWGSEEFRQLCRKDLLTFCKAINPNFEQPHHIKLMARELQNVETRQTKRLMITVPPRHGKSYLSSQMFPAWYLGRHPEHFLIATAYAQTLSDDWGEWVRDVMAEPIYQWIFPESVLRKSSKSRSKFTTLQGGKGFFVGIGGTITGRGAHTFLIDDPFKDDEAADSEAVRKAVRNFYRGTAYTRLMPNAAIIIISTRWRHDDLIGWLLDPREQERIADWKRFDFPAIADEDTTDWRQPGEALWPERYNITDLEQIKMEGVGTRAFQAMYQQKPTAAEGNIFKKAYLKEVSLVDLENDLISPKIMFMDTAFKEDQHNDYSAAVCGCRTRSGEAVILDAMHRRLDFPKLLEWTKNMITIHEIEALYIEDKASGQSLYQTLKKELTIPVIAVKCENDKVSRANAILPFVESGKVLHRKPINMDLEQELLQFPFAAHDDLVDAYVGLITVLTRANFSLSLNKAKEMSLPGTIYGR